MTSIVDEEAIEIALDDALRRRLLTLPRLKWRIRTIGASPAESPLETRFVRLLKQAGLPLPENQFDDRRNWLEALGWRVINVTDTQMRHARSTLIERLRKMLP